MSELIYLPGHFAKIRNSEGRTVARTHALIDGTWATTRNGVHGPKLGSERAAVEWIKTMAIAEALS